MSPEIQSINPSVWNLEKWYWWTYLHNRNTDGVPASKLWYRYLLLSPSIPRGLVASCCGYSLGLLTISCWSPGPLYHLCKQCPVSNSLSAIITLAPVASDSENPVQPFNFNVIGQGFSCHKREVTLCFLKCPSFHFFKKVFYLFIFKLENNCFTMLF